MTKQFNFKGALENFKYVDADPRELIILFQEIYDSSLVSLQNHL